MQRQKRLHQNDERLGNERHRAQVFTDLRTDPTWEDHIETR